MNHYGESAHLRTVFPTINPRFPVRASGLDLRLAQPAGQPLPTSVPSSPVRAGSGTPHPRAAISSERVAGCEPFFPTARSELVIASTSTVAPIGALRTITERCEGEAQLAFQEPDASQAEALALDHVALVERVAADLRLTQQEADELRLSARRVVRGVRRMHGNVRGAISVLQRGYIVPNVYVEFADVMGPDDAA